MATNPRRPFAGTGRNPIPFTPDSLPDWLQVPYSGHNAAADAAWNSGAVEALREAVTAQGRHSRAKWADALSISVRPVITYWFMAPYCAAKTAAFVGAVDAGVDWMPAVQAAWTEADQALWAGVLNFWFLGRVFDRVRA